MSPSGNYTPIKLSIASRRSHRILAVPVISTLALAALTVLTIMDYSRSTTPQLAQVIGPTPSLIQVAAHADPPSPTPTIVASDSAHLATTLKGRLDRYISEAEGIYGVSVIDTRTKETYSFNAERPFQSASLYKLWIMAITEKEIEEGTLRSTDFLSNDATKLNERLEIATESAQVKEGAVGMTVEDALEAMITLSDNYAALLLTDRLGMKKVNEFLEQHTYSGSTFDQPPMTTMGDIMSYLSDVQAHTLISESVDQAILDRLSRQKLKHLAAKYLPRDTVMAHKTANLGNFAHDAGIVTSPGGEYIYVIMSEGNPDVTSDVIAQISEKIYTYYNPEDAD